MRFINLVNSVLAAAVGLSLATAKAQEPKTALPYRIDYFGWFTVDVMVNGRGPYDFIIDTGATQSFVFESLAQEHDFPPSGGPPQTVLGFASAGKFPTFAIGDLAIGAERFENLVGVILPDWGINDVRSPKGVLGLDFLTQYDVVFDAERRELRLYGPSEAPIETSRKWRAAPLEASEFGLDAGLIYTVTARLLNRPVPLLIDLGASGTVINKPAYRATVGAQVRLVQRNPARITDALEKTVHAGAFRTDRFRIGRTAWYNQIIYVQDASIFEDLGVSNRPFGLFGADLVHDRSFILDFAGKRLLIGPPVKY